jgi:hypothetical protein
MNTPLADYRLQYTYTTKTFAKNGVLTKFKRAEPAGLVNLVIILGLFHRLHPFKGLLLQRVSRTVRKG